jgi:hypothetical protein
LTFHTEPPIKYESPYSSEPPKYDSNGTPLKRRYSETVNNAQESDEKRQRIEVDNSFSDDLDFAAMIAQAAATATQEINGTNVDYTATQTGTTVEDPFQSQQQHYQPQPIQQHQPQQQQAQPQSQIQTQPLQQQQQQHQPFQQPIYAPPPETASSGFSADPHLYMRICSLPILESLVCAYLTS